MNQLFTVGQLSRIFDVKISTLRYYDEIGILKLAQVNTGSRYRYYSTEQFERLNVITYLRSLGLSLNSIKDFFENRDTLKLEKMLKEQKFQIQQQIKILKNTEQRIDSQINQVEDAIHSTLDKIEIVQMSEIPIIYLNENYHLNEDIEISITSLRKKYDVDKNIFLGKIALTLSQQQLDSGKFDNYSGLLLILEPGDDEEFTSKLEAGTYLRLRFNGTHETSSVQYRKLIDYCQRHRYQIIGDAIETALIDYGITNDLTKYVTEIRIPVKEI